MIRCPLVVLSLLTACSSGPSYPAGADDPAPSDETGVPEEPEGVVDCDAPANERATPSAASDAVARDVSLFGVSLLRARTDENAFLAPLNIATALGMTLAGADGTTATELRTLLGGDGDDAALHAGLAELSATFLAASSAEDVECPTWRFAAGNNAFVDQRLDPYPDYLATLAAPYGVTPLELDYEGDPVGAAEAINDWAGDVTRGNVTEIADPNAYDYYTLLVLGSATWFAGNWVDPFDGETRAEPFTRADGTPSDVPMMRGTRVRAWGRVGDATVVELPYRGEDLVMLLVVPDAVDGLDAVLAGLDPDALSPEALEAFGPGQIEVVMPTFEVRSNASLRRPLMDLGAAETFDRNLANLSRLAPVPPMFDNMFVSDVVHEAWIRVDEAGTEAAAATTVEIEGTDSAAPVPETVRADRPFAYLIRDRVTGVVLFAGRMDAPPVE